MSDMSNMNITPPADMIEMVCELYQDKTDAELRADIESIRQVLSVLESMEPLSPKDADNREWTRQMLGAHQHELDRRVAGGGIGQHH